MPILGVYGHAALRERLLERARAGTLPASLLLHGAAGVGKQRLALWLGQTLLCSDGDPPCGRCQHCRYSLALTHPDLTWVFPRPRPRDSEASPDEIAADLAGEAASRAEAGGVYPRPAGNEGIYVATVRMLVRKAALAPALARRKVFVIGDAERMVPQEGADEAANAFLKLLEEPPADTFLILTSSEPASLLPTIRSRVIGVRVARLKERDVRAFLADPVVAAALPDREEEALVAASQGAPGALFNAAARSAAIGSARKLVAAALDSAPAGIYETALSQSVSGARGAFTDVLEELTVVISERTRDAIRSGDEAGARAGVRGIESVETARERAGGNVNPQLLTWRLLRDLSRPGS
jgi:DNA polymerase III subunit delta'